MNSDEIDRFLRVRLRDFDGVFSIDRLPDHPHLLVCNTDPSDKPGRHWIAIYVDDEGRGDFFDSFGRRPSDYLERYMNRNCLSWNFNDRQLQSIVSKFCGHYCISVFFAVEVLICVRLCVVLVVIRDLMMCWYIHMCVVSE